MKQMFCVAILSVFCYNCVKAQYISTNKANRFADFTATVGNSEGSASLSYVDNWRLGKNKKIEIGFGARLTSYLGIKKDFITAPARLARSTSVPFLVVFAAQEEQNFDTLVVQRPLTFSANATINLGYNFNSRLYGGFNIDLIGVTLGRTTSAVFKSNGSTTTEPAAKPSPFNLLLTGDNDLGSLNSEFFLKYKLSSRVAVKAVYQFLFVEYKTTTLSQTAPDGTSVNRFRNKSNQFGIGLSYAL